MAVQRLEADGDGRPVLRKDGAPGPEAERLRRELANLTAAAHPGVVQVVGVEEGDDGGVALRLAVAGTRTFADLRTDLEGAARALAGLATTVADLHDLGLVHGRVTADHVVLDGAGRAVLCGFAEAGPRGELDPAVDVLGLGTLLGSILTRAGAGPDGGWEPIPERRFGRGDRWLGFVRRALLTLADQATDDDPARRPTARAFAAAVLASLPAPAATGAPRLREGLLAHGARARRAVGDAVAAAAARRPRADPDPSPEAPLDAVAMLLAGAGDDRGGERRRSWPGAPSLRRLGAPVAAAVGLGLLVFGIGALLRPARGPSSSLAAPSPTAAAPSSTPSSGPAITTTAAVPVPAPPLACVAVAPPAADPDGDGCPSTVHVGDAVVEVDGVRYGVGRPGDLLAVGDWDCDGAATVALVHRSTGEVFLFDGWATGATEATATSRGTVPGAEAVAPPDGCGALVVLDAAGARTEVPA